MAPLAGFNTEILKTNARKDLLNLLEGVSKVHVMPELGRNPLICI
jgi:hypothetical protein